MYACICLVCVYIQVLFYCTATVWTRHMQAAHTGRFQSHCLKSDNVSTNHSWNFKSLHTHRRTPTCTQTHTHVPVWHMRTKLQRPIGTLPTPHTPCSQTEDRPLWAFQGPGSALRIAPWCAAGHMERPNNQNEIIWNVSFYKRSSWCTSRTGPVSAPGRFERNASLLRMLWTIQKNSAVMRGNYV